MLMGSAKDEHQEIGAAARQRNKRRLELKLEAVRLVIGGQGQYVIARVQRTCGGTDEIMKEPASRSM
jgi:hypothetical protein